MEIWSGVHLIEGVRGCNCYLITMPSLALIDTGIPGQSRKVVAYLANLGYDPQDLKWMILTHHDVDHVGSAAQLQRLTGAEVCMHPADVDCLLGRVPRRPRWKARLSMLCSRLELPEIDTLLEDGQNIGPLEVIHTPGHSPGSISLLYGSVLFTGDLLRWGRFLKQTLRIISEDSTAARASIKKISDHNFYLLCPGHGKPVPGAAPKLRELASRWDT